MKRFLSFSLGLACCLCLLLATERRALAYIDPGTGLLALQSAAAALTAGLYYMRRRILAFFGKKSTPPASMPVVVKSGSRKAA